MAARADVTRSWIACLWTAQTGSTMADAGPLQGSLQLLVQDQVKLRQLSGQTLQNMRLRALLCECGLVSWAKAGH